MSEKLDIDEFLDRMISIPVVDVRSPSEYEKGHIVGAENLPLFDDDQRARVGISYKHNGREQAVLKGLELVGPKLKPLAKKLLDRSVDFDGSKRILIHCWRGGMRSQSMAWLAEQVGIAPTVLVGGYKAYRRHVQNSFRLKKKLIVLSGLTGSGKTLALRKLAENGEQVVDLERLANHRGSALGGIGLEEQPTVEHFENLVFEAFRQLDHSRVIWVEDESRKIGAATIPNDLLLQIKSAPAIFLDVSRATREQIVVAEYGPLPDSEIAHAIGKIAKRMGGQNSKAACEALAVGDVSRCVRLLFEYYDRGYMNAKAKMVGRQFFEFATESPAADSTCRELINLSKQIVCENQPSPTS